MDIVRRPVFTVDTSHSLLLFRCSCLVCRVYCIGVGLAKQNHHLRPACREVFHRLSGAVELDTGHPLLLRNALQGVARGHAGIGTQQRLWRPVSWAVLTGGAGLVSSPCEIV